MGGKGVKELGSTCTNNIKVLIREDDEHGKTKQGTPKHYHDDDQNALKFTIMMIISSKEH